MLKEYYDQKAELKSFTRPEWMKNPGRVNFEDIQNIPDEEFERIENQFRETEQQNNRAERTNRELYEQVQKIFIKDLEDIGVTVRGIRGGILQPFKNTLLEIKYKISGRSFPARPNPEMYYEGKVIRMCGSLSEKLKRLKQHGLREIENEHKNNEMFFAAVKYMQENGIETNPSMNRNDIIDLANRHAKEKYISDNYPSGTDMDLDDNYCECGGWTVGERRCDCGNRRVYLEVDGDIINGFHAYAEAY